MNLHHAPAHWEGPGLNIGGQLIWEVFKYTVEGHNVSMQLLQLHQGPDTAVDYAVKFRMLAALSVWNDVALWAFREGLNPILLSGFTDLGPKCEMRQELGKESLIYCKDKQRQACSQ